MLGTHAAPCDRVVLVVFRDIKGIDYHFCFSGYSRPNFDTSEITNYFEMDCIWQTNIMIQVLKLIQIGNITRIEKNHVTSSQLICSVK